MPSIQSSASVALSSVNENVLADSQFEYMPYDATIQIGINGDANGGDLRCDVYSGQDILVENLDCLWRDEKATLRNQDAELHLCFCVRARVRIRDAAQGRQKHDDR